MDYYRNSSSSLSAGLLLRDAGLLLLRLAAAASLAGWHAILQAETGWRHLWRKTPWPFRDDIAAFGFPLPLAVSITAVVLTLLAVSFLISGLLCRTAAALLIAFCFLTAFLYRHYPPVLESAGLYSVIFTVLLICGPGRFSLESLLLSRKRRI